MDFGLSREFARGPWSPRQLIGDAQLGDDVNRLGRLVTGDQFRDCLDRVGHVLRISEEHRHFFTQKFDLAHGFAEIRQKA